MAFIYLRKEINILSILFFFLFKKSHWYDALCLCIIIIIIIIIIIK